MKWDISPWLLDQIADILADIEHDHARYLHLAATLAGLYAEWSEM